MADPFQDVDAAGAAFIKTFADAMDVRQSEPVMEQIVADYLSMLSLRDEATVIEVGAGAGAVTRRIAAHVHPAEVIGYEPSRGFVAEARTRAADTGNLRFEEADGTALPRADNSADAAILHTVLTHVTHPEALITEAVRVLKPGGSLIICDADFSKATFSSFANDPLDACARAFVGGFVTDPFIVGKLRRMIADAGLTLDHFGVESRVVTTAQSMLPWVEVTTKGMVDRGEIGQALADALIAEHDRRAANGTLYGYQAFATAKATKPA
ncbi:methyltransferase domain-containing protein [Tateyamaria sp. SN6-1]|uniref:methyltransferase domain-containing protein n=1 Tax=Tateyamaria sp. SN6-1 TaxID=3092148 RepID=UPI0039F54280